MITLKQKETGWNALFVASLVAIAFFGWYSFLRTPERPTANRQTAQAMARIDAANDQADKALAEIRARTWNQTPEALAAQTLNRLTQIAERNKLALTSFRGDRTVEKQGLTEAPFVVVVDGAFPSVLSFLEQVDQPGSKLATELLQIQASEGHPGSVTATVGLLGFLLPEDKKS
jgi:hypothetical protein